MTDDDQTANNTSNTTLISVYPFKIIQSVSKVLLFIVKTSSEVFRTDTWKEIGGIDMTIKLLSNELKLIHANTTSVKEYLNIFNAAGINQIISSINNTSMIEGGNVEDGSVKPNLIMTEKEQQSEEKLSYLKNLFRLLK
jgi:hypothetical protein